MKTIHLRSSIHEIIDRIQSEQLLQALYDFLKEREKVNAGALWESLTETQKREVMLSEVESDDEKNLIEANAIFKRMK